MPVCVCECNRISDIRSTLPVSPKASFHLRHAAEQTRSIFSNRFSNCCASKRIRRPLQAVLRATVQAGVPLTVYYIHTACAISHHAMAVGSSSMASSRENFMVQNCNSPFADVRRPAKLCTFSNVYINKYEVDAHINVATLHSNLPIFSAPCMRCWAWRCVCVCAACIKPKATRNGMLYYICTAYVLHFKFYAKEKSFAHE